MHITFSSWASLPMMHLSRLGPYKIVHLLVNVVDQFDHFLQFILEYCFGSMLVG